MTTFRDIEVEPKGTRKYHSTTTQTMLLDWFSAARPNVMATLTFKGMHGVRIAAAERTFKRFSANLLSEVSATHPKAEVRLVPVVENSSEQLRSYGLTPYGREGTHLHVLMRLPGDLVEQRERVRKLWIGSNKMLCGDPRVYCPESNDWFVELTTRAERSTYISYVVKHMRNDCLGLLVHCMKIDPRQPA
jgi:hypothetical protein